MQIDMLTVVGIIDGPLGIEWELSVGGWFRQVVFITMSG